MNIVMTTLKENINNAQAAAEMAADTAGMNCDVIISQNERGEGYVAGMNKALEQVPDGEYFVTLNDDSFPETEGWLAILYRELRKREEALDVWFAGPSGGCRTMPQNTGRMGDRRKPRIVGHLAGFCMLCSPRVLDKVGLMDDQYLHYAGEVDWQWRAKRDHGAKMIWVPEVYVAHDVHAPNQEWWDRDHKILNTVWRNK